MWRARGAPAPTGQRLHFAEGAPLDGGGPPLEPSVWPVTRERSSIAWSVTLGTAQRRPSGRVGFWQPLSPRPVHLCAAAPSSAPNPIPVFPLGRHTTTARTSSMRVHDHSHSLFPVHAKKRGSPALVRRAAGGAPPPPAPAPVVCPAGALPPALAAVPRGGGPQCTREPNTENYKGHKRFHLTFKLILRHERQ